MIKTEMAMSGDSRSSVHTASSTSPLTIEEGLKMTILDLGVEFSYTVPSFSVLSVPLRQTTVQTVDNDGCVHLYDGFIRSDSCLNSLVIPFCVQLRQFCFVTVSLSTKS